MTNNYSKKWVIHYRDKCIGCGNCPLMSPKYWRMNSKDGKADLILGKKVNRVFKRTLDPEDITNNEQAAKQCPVGVIKIL